MLVEFVPLLLLGFGLGFIHALDADHVMAVSMLANEKPGFKRSLSHSLYWALGHGGVLLIVGLMFYGMGLTFPETMQRCFEFIAGALLILLGVLFFLQVRREQIKLRVHRHGDVIHSHWHDDHHNNKSSHKPVFIGAVHGLAGNAPVLALIPAVNSGQLGLAVVYLTLFSIGVMLSMLIFGLGFSVFQHYVSQRYTLIFQYGRHLLASGSILLGSFWLMHAM